MIFLKLHRGRGFTPIVPVNGSMLDTQQIYYRDGPGTIWRSIRAVCAGSGLSFARMSLSVQIGGDRG
jgi:hypothetical protein